MVSKRNLVSFLHLHPLQLWNFKWYFLLCDTPIDYDHLKGYKMISLTRVKEMIDWLVLKIDSTQKMLVLGLNSIFGAAYFKNQLIVYSNSKTVFLTPWISYKIFISKAHLHFLNYRAYSINIFKVLQNLGLNFTNKLSNIFFLLRMFYYKHLWCL